MLVASWVTAIATICGVAIAGAALIVAAVSIVQAGRQLRSTARNEAANSDALTRPYIGVDIVPSIGGRGAMDIVFENRGRSVARDIAVSLVDDHFRSQSSLDEIGPALGRLFATPFDLAPGARRRVFWRMPADELATPSGDIWTPIVGEVAIDYAWDPRDGREDRRYSDSIRYDLTEYPKLTPLAGAGAEARAGADQAVEKNAVHALRAIARSIGELSR